MNTLHPDTIIPQFWIETIGEDPWRAHWAKTASDIYTYAANRLAIRQLVGIYKPSVL
jgi:hypothetical protein